MEYNMDLSTFEARGCVYIHMHVTPLNSQDVFIGVSCPGLTMTAPVGACLCGGTSWCRDG